MAKYGIRESLKQYAIVDMPAAKPVARARRLPDEASAAEPSFVHTMQFMTDSGTASYRVHPRMSTRLPQQRQRSKFAFDKNATSRRPTAAWFGEPRVDPLVEERRAPWH